jgi:molybdate transport system substrate-binding protein
MVNKWLTHVGRAAAFWWLTVFAALADQTQPLTVFAAASLGDVLRAANADWPQNVRLSLAGSGAIARQIDQGAPADVVMLANPDWMDWLDDRGLLQPGTRSTPYGNTLVLVGPPGAAPMTQLSLEVIHQRLGPDGRLAIGEHRSVPAGIYARNWMQSKGLWNELHPQLAEGENVRAALALVTRGEVPLALIYASDLVAAPDQASVVWIIPAKEQPRIRYALAALTPRGRAYADYITSPEVAEIFARFGFVVEDL